MLVCVSSLAAVLLNYEMASCANEMSRQPFNVFQGRGAGESHNIDINLKDQGPSARSVYLLMAGGGLLIAFERQHSCRCFASKRTFAFAKI